MPDQPLRVLHVITCLRTGGAEAMLARLLEHRPPGQQDLIVCMLSGGNFAGKIAALGIPVFFVPFDRPCELISALLRLPGTIKKFYPSIVVGWMYHGNLLAWVLQKIFFPKLVLVWNLLGTLYDIRHEKPLSRPVIRLGAMLSQKVNRILYNGTLSRKQHEAIGYSAVYTGIVYNGFDFGKTFPDPAAGLKLRAEWGIPPEAPVIGMVARYHPMKDHENFLRAAKTLSQSHPDARFALAGWQVDAENENLMRLIRELNLTDKIILLSERADGDILARGFTIGTLSSARGENLPNVLGEAMACGAPCVATNIGDVSVMIGDAGIVVQPSNPAALAAGWAQLLDMPPADFADLRSRAIARARDEFSIARAVANYDAEFRLALQSKS